jgi:D-3-phosphoglycerate dehydrogenase / 2-oxoglutarate reductase
MFEVKKLNSIDDVVNELLPAEAFRLSTDAAQPDGVLVRSANMHDTPLAPNLAAVARAGAGVNNIPVDKCADAGIVVFNTPGANANAVKELAVAGLLMSGRRIVDGVLWVNGIKDKGAEVPALVEKGKNDFVGPELLGRKLGVIGLGAIGAMVANAAVALGLEVTGFDPFISVEAAWGLSRSVKRSTDLDSLIRNSDFLSLHVPLMDKTRGMMGKKQFDEMKEGAVLLNFARGELVEKDALLAALDAGKLRKYVTDFPFDYLLGRQDVICIPHLGASTPESERNCAIMAANQLKAYLLDGDIINSVNYPDCCMPRSGAFRLAVLHRNVTNMVGQIATALAAEKHNITNMINKSRGSFAYTLIDLDDEPTDKCVTALSQIEGVLRVRKL